MILVEAGTRDEQGFDTRLVFTELLRRAGLMAGIDDSTLPESLHRSQKYEAVEVLVSLDDIEPAGVVLLDAQNATDAMLSKLRGYKLGADRPVVAIGRFETRQQRIGTQAKIAFAAGTEPELLDLKDIQPSTLLAGVPLPLFATATERAFEQDRPRVLVYVPGDMTEELDFEAKVSMLGAMRDFDVAILTSAKAKDALQSMPRTTMPIYSYAELSPRSFADLAEIAVVLGDGSPGQRMAQLGAEIIGAGGILIDGTQAGCLSQCPAPVVRGPSRLSELPGFLEGEILPRKNAIQAEVRSSQWRRTNDLSHLIARFPAAFRPDPSRARKTPALQRTMFLPTNGVGLGHSQRCSLIAAQMPEKANVSFAAFPSCIDLVEQQQFPCRPLVQKSEAHVDSYANDIVNYKRLRRALAPGDRLVFDGVYVFDSIYRTILERDLEAIWIRRGLWRANQTNQTALAREHVFQRVVVPREAFDELNQHYSFGENIHHVGPIVRLPEAGSVDTTRKAVSRELGVTFSRLVVSMLGGGVAADRGPQLQTICAALEGQNDLLHLVVVWPNAKVAPELTLWKNTRVVRALDALRLAKAADFVVTAVGYNSFHEVLYHRIPAIFIPQTAPYMDDQERRALAATERGLAEIVLPDELLMLDRKITAFLESGRAEGLREQLAALDLPEPGNLAAAQIIAGGKHDTRRLA